MIQAALMIAVTTVAQAGQVQTIKIPGTVTELRMVRIPDGTTEVNGKKVEIKDLWVAETETTWDLYDVFAFRLDLTQEEQVAGVQAKSRPSKPYGSPDSGFGHAGYPAMRATYYAALMYCEWLSDKTGKKFRLPKETEWEYYTKAGARNLPSDLEKVGWMWENSEDKTWPVGKKPANAYGLFDTFGNLAEWVVGTDNRPALAGGSWKDKKATVDLARRDKQTPAWNRTDPQNPKSKWWLSDGDFVGFRVVCTDQP